MSVYLRLFFEFFKTGLFAVGGGGDCVMLCLEHRTHQAAGVFVVIDDENVKHGGAPFCITAEIVFWICGAGSSRRSTGRGGAAPRRPSRPAARRQ